VVVVASCGPRGRAIKLRVGDRDPVRGLRTGNEHLTTDEGDLDVVDPDKIGASEGDSISSPNILWVEFSDVDVLDDHILGAVGDAETFASNYSLAANANNRFIRLHVD
jgi:hypothetical protein